MCVCVYLFIYLCVYLFIYSCLFIFIVIVIVIVLSPSPSRRVQLSYIFIYLLFFSCLFIVCVCLYMCMCPKKSSHAAMSRGNLNWPNVQLNVAIMSPTSSQQRWPGAKSPSLRAQSCRVLQKPGAPFFDALACQGSVSSLDTLWKWLTVRHGISMAHRNRWFTCLPFLRMVDLSMAMLYNQIVQKIMANHCRSS